MSFNEVWGSLVALLYSDQESSEKVVLAISSASILRRLLHEFDGAPALLVGQRQVGRLQCPQQR